MALMKKSITTAILLVNAVSASLLLADKPVTIVTYYQSLPEAFAGKKVGLTVRGGKWVAENRSGGCADPLVDIDKGYMEFGCSKGGSAKRQYMSFPTDSFIFLQHGFVPENPFEEFLYSLYIPDPVGIDRKR